ncbi:MAG: class I SAM-dependent methyltransferase [Actinomycetota bacterium]|jgi:ubiquinone/menaquinone biosynthesis C-methylase UbiE|nr:class I SAM-dependent methyltransferase [Rubrobacter sp.]MDQ3508931.1 class I SAM-dependent methyltransferase [Actinomycetota bacterium]
MTAQPQAPDMSAVKERMRKVWTSGEYARIGNPLVLIGELLCEAADLRSGDNVLDVATGSGNTAISAARRFCDVTGMDLAPESIEHARRRAEAEGMGITFDVGDAEDLSYPDASFDVVLSTIGVMFCPNQEKAAGEMLRVCRPGGKIGVASWAPDGFTGQMLKTVGKHVPPPPGIKPPSLWGTEERFTELLGEGVSSLDATRRSYVFRYPSAGHFVEWFRDYYGPTVRAFAALDPDGREALAKDLGDLLESWNTSGDDTLVVSSDYLEAVAVRR